MRLAQRQRATRFKVNIDVVVAVKFVRPHIVDRQTQPVGQVSEPYADLLLRLSPHIGASGFDVDRDIFEVRILLTKPPLDLVRQGMAPAQCSLLDPPGYEGRRSSPSRSPGFSLCGRI